MILCKYRINIIWSEEDSGYLVELPEFATPIQRYFTHGDTYDEALTNAQEVLELLIESYRSEGKVLPEPQVLQVARGIKLGEVGGGGDR
jgi:predicted RNase H-like HicB family nuclease